MQQTTDYACAFCGELNTTFIDLSAGSHQRYIEDCQVCCQPNQLFITIDETTLEVTITADPVG